MWIRYQNYAMWEKLVQISLTFFLIRKMHTETWLQRIIRWPPGWEVFLSRLFNSPTFFYALYFFGSMKFWIILHHGLERRGAGLPVQAKLKNLILTLTLNLLLFFIIIKCGFFMVFMALFFYSFFFFMKEMSVKLCDFQQQHVMVFGQW